MEHEHYTITSRHPSSLSFFRSLKSSGAALCLTGKALSVPELKALMHEWDKSEQGVVPPTAFECQANEERRMITFPEKIFVTGTGTDVGKTFVSAMLLCGLDASYWKPVNQADRQIQTFSNLLLTSHCPSSNRDYTFEDPVSPHLAAEMPTCRSIWNSFKFQIAQIST